LDFSDFDLHDDLLNGIAAMNFKKPTPIQEQAIPIILSGRDLIGVAQTGTGKTAAFTLPVLDLIMDHPHAGFNQALILVPTRELAIQIDQAVEAYAYFTGTSSVAIYGGGDGKEFNREKNALTQGADIVIATPGRLISHINMGYVDFSKLRFLILDEADRMLDMGFMPDLMKIVRTVNPKRQTLLFSATMPGSVKKFAHELTNKPELITIALSKPAEGVSQGVFIIPEEQKIPLLLRVLEDKKGLMTLIFCSTKQSVSKLYQKLRTKQFNVAQISSDLEQKDREEVMRSFRNRQVEMLVATDVLSRGIDIDGIELVINFDVPQDAEDYVHRIGRTARAQRTGEAITLVSGKEMYKYNRIEALIGREIPRLPMPAGLPPAAPAGAAAGGGARRPKSNRPEKTTEGTKPSGGQDRNRRRNRHKPKSGNKPGGESTPPRTDG
jgi:superfamily II DNA/RNA helicase